MLDKCHSTQLRLPRGCYIFCYPPTNGKCPNLFTFMDLPIQNKSLTLANQEYLSTHRRCLIWFFCLFACLLCFLNGRAFFSPDINLNTNEPRNSYPHPTAADRFIALQWGSGRRRRVNCFLIERFCCHSNHAELWHQPRTGRWVDLCKKYLFLPLPFCKYLQQKQERASVQICCIDSELFFFLSFPYSVVGR